MNIFQLIYHAQDYKTTLTIEEDKLESIHFSAWKAAKEKYIGESKQTIKFKKSSLVTSQQGQIKAIERVLSKATDAKIIKMKKAQLERLELAFKGKQKQLDSEIEKCDIVATKLAVGILRVEG